MRFFSASAPHLLSRPRPHPSLHLRGYSGFVGRVCFFFFTPLKGHANLLDAKTTRKNAFAAAWDIYSRFQMDFKRKFWTSRSTSHSQQSTSEGCAPRLGSAKDDLTLNFKLTGPLKMYEPFSNSPPIHLTCCRPWLISLYISSRPVLKVLIHFWGHRLRNFKISFLKKKNIPPKLKDTVSVLAVTLSPSYFHSIAFHSSSTLPRKRVVGRVEWRN